MRTRKGMVMVVWALSAAAMGQGLGSIEGKLLDEAGKPVPYASVSAAQGDNVRTAESDERGWFTIKPLQAGEYAVRIRTMDMDLTKDGVMVLPDDITRMGEITMSGAKELVGVIVVRERYVPPMIEHDNTGVTKVSHKQFTNNPNKVDPVKL